MSPKTTPGRILHEAVAPYGAGRSAAPHAKLSISLPADLLEVVRSAAAESGESVSAIVAAALRRTLEDAALARLDAAIAAQNDENLEWANAVVPIASRLWSELEW